MSFCEYLGTCIFYVVDGTTKGCAPIILTFSIIYLQFEKSCFNVTRF